MKKLLLSFACLLGTLISNAQCVGALDLPTSADYVQFASPFYSYTNELTVEGWVYVDGSVNSTPWIGQATAGLDNMGTNVWHWHGANPNELAWQVNDNGTWRSANSTTMSNGWHHVATVADNVSTRIYIDGVLDATGPGISGAIVNNSGSEIHVGHDVRFAAGAGGRNGDYKIGELRVWSVARTQSELSTNMSSCLTGSETGLKLYNKFENGTGSSATSAVGPNGTLVNMTPATNWVNGSGSECCTPASALNFDGTDDFVAINSTSLLSMTNAVTIEAWVKTSASGEQYIVTKNDDSFYMGVNVDGNFGKASFYIGGVSDFSGGWLYSNASNINNNTWHHVAGTYDGSTIKIYIDGVLDKSVAATGTIATGPNNVNLGCRSNNYFFQGSMDEVRIWDIARTDCEINSYMNCEIPTTATGLVANYHFNQGIDAGNNSSITTLTDDSGNSNTGTLGNFSLSGSTSNWIAPAAVTSGNITPGACTAAAALNFDGTDGITLNTFNISGASARTVEFWLKTTVTGNFQTPFASGSSNPNEAFNFKVTPTGHLGFMGYANDYFPSSGTLIADNTYHHIALTYNGTNVKAYVDGNLEWTFTTALTTIGNNNYLGRSNHTGFEQYFVGTMDEVRVWNVERTRCEIISYKNCEIPTTATGLVANYHFNQGVAFNSNPTVITLVDASGNSNTGTLANFNLTGSSSNWVSPGAVASGFTTSIACPVAAALSFDGSNDYVEIGNVIPSGSSYTKEMWVYALDNSCNNLLSSGDDPFYLSSGRLAAGNNGNYNYVQDGTNFPLNTWVHAAVTYDALTSTMVLYVNGIMVASGNSAGPYSGAPTTYIGRHTGACYFSGKLDEVRVWNVARTQCEINTYMNSEITNSMTGLLANYHFNQGLASYSNPTETILADASGNGVNVTLNNFGLTGSTSNWIAPGGVVSGYTTTTITPPVISVTSGSICAGQSFTMVPSGASTYTFSNGTDVVMPTSDATYSVSGTSSVGCVSLVEAVASVTVHALPTITVTSGAICAGESFTMTPGGASTYTFSNGTDVVTPSSDATYSISGTSSVGCVSSVEAVASVTVNALPTVTASASNSVICVGQSTTLNGAGAVGYVWNGGSTPNNYPLYPSTTSTYVVVGTDANGCVGTATQVVTVNALPTLTVATTSTLLCTGETATLSVSGASSYTWSTGEAASDIVVTPASQATYTVDGTDVNGCMNNTTITQDVSLCTGIVSNSSVNSTVLSIYPNPNNGTFTVKSDTDMQLNLTNALGQLIQVIELNHSNNHQMMIDVLANGVYFITGQNENQSVKQKVIVTK
ncbi:MAG: hypothetical protein K0S53_1184 [Bacteroidetes bacterium]|jgi:hypothetical protein|nr:hypothetical protein [Bacteroidota bacterium]